MAVVVVIKGNVFLFMKNLNIRMTEVSACVYSVEPRCIYLMEVGLDMMMRNSTELLQELIKEINLSNTISSENLVVKKIWGN
jgi:hypothetical protein